MALRPRTMTLSRLLAAASALVLLVGATLASAPGHAAPGTSFTNPVVSPPNSADPWIGNYNGSYYYTATTWTGDIFIRKSATLAGLSSAPETRVFTLTQPNAYDNMWAPSMHLLNGPNGLRWYYYYAAGPDGCCGGQRTHVLESAGTDPMGPYTYKGKLNLMPNDGWAIDSSIMTLNGVNYIVFSAFHTDGLQSNFIARMTNPWTPASFGRLMSQPLLAWERQGQPVNEGPYVLQRNGRTFMTYSASYCGTPDYKLGMIELVGSDPLQMSSWRKHANPIFQRNDANGVYGPGHHTFFSSPDGTETWIMYHANSSPTQKCGTTRSSRAQKISWNADGTPNLGVPVSTSTVLPGPSGESVSSYYRVTARHSGKVMDVQSPNTSDGAKVGQYAWNGGAWQQWEFRSAGSGYVNLVSRHSGKCLDVPGGSAADGVQLSQWTCNGGTNQQFQMVAVGSYFQLRARHSGKCVDVPAASTADGAVLTQYTCNNGTNQQWSRSTV